MYRLWFANSPTPRPPLTVTEDRLLMGRDPACQLRLTEPGVSDQHAAIERRAAGSSAEAGWYLRDLDSANGVRVNDQPVTDHRLATGDTIEIGAVRLRFEVLHESGERRRFSALQIAAAVVIAGTLAGQLAVIIWVFHQPRSRDMRVFAGTQVDDTPAQPAEPPAPVPAPAPVAPAPAPTPASQPAPATPVVLTRKIRVVSLERTATGLKIVARAQVGERTLDTKLVTVTVERFIVDAQNRTVSAGAPVAVPIPSSWQNFESTTLAVRLAAPTKRDAGIVVRTFYRGELQDVAVSSPALLTLVNSATPR